MSFEEHASRQAKRFAEATPSDRLKWLEQTKRFVHAAISQSALHCVRVVSRNAIRRFSWAKGWDGYRLLDRHRLSVTEACMPAGARAPEHRHARAQKFYYVLEGSMEVEVEGRVHALSAREGIEVSTGLLYSLRNPGNVDAWFLAISEPSTGDDTL